MDTKLCSKCYKDRDLNDFQLQNGRTSNRCKICRDSINQYYSQYRQTENYKDWLHTSMKEHSKKYYENNKDKIKDQHERNKEKIRDYQLQYYQENKDKLTDYHKKYRKDHLDEIHKKEKQYRDQNKDKINENRKKYSESHKDDLLTKIVCPCGGHYCKKTASRHNKTKKHQIYLNKQ
jgi:hypothetical protein